MKRISIALLTTVLGLGLGTLGAQAQQQQTWPSDDSVCGTWQGDTWVPSGNCPVDTDVHRHARLAGTITAVKGHLVTVQLTDRTVVINDQPALNRQMSGKVAVGREIVAHGYWNAGTFYATHID